MKSTSASLSDPNEIVKWLQAIHADQEWLKENLKRLVDRQTIKDYYTTEEFGQLVNLQPKTVRDYCSQGKLHGEKRKSGHGRAKRWVLSHNELDSSFQDFLY